MAKIPLKAIIFSLSIFWMHLQAQPASQHFQASHYGVEQGLSQGSNYFNLRDSRGFLWFSSYEGLNRFDGRQFQRFYPNINDSTAMQGAEVLGMVEDAWGNIWFGTEMCLNKYDRMSGKFSSFGAIGNSSANSYSQTHPFYADSTEVWFANDRDGIMSYDFSTNKMQLVDSTLRYKIDYYFNYRVVSKGKGNFWMSQEKGLVHVNLNENCQNWYFSGHAQNIVGEPSEVFTYFVDNQTVWLGLNTGLVKLDLENGKFQHVPSPYDFSKNIIYSIQVDTADRVWIATADEGVLLHNPKTGQFAKLANLLGEPRRYHQTQAAAMNFEPMENVLWVNTEPDGLDKVSLDVERIQSRRNDPADQTDLNASVVRCFTEDKYGRIWLGVWDGGVNVFDPKTGKFQYHLSQKDDPTTLPDKTVLGICTDSYGRIWAATENGVGCYEETSQGKGRWRRFFNKSNQQLTVNANLCASVCPLTGNQIAVGTAAGLFLLNVDSGVFTPVNALSKVPRLVRNLFYDSKRERLFASMHLNGIGVLERKGDVWHLLTSGLSGMDTNGFYIEENNSDTAWIGTINGLACYDLNTQKYRMYTVADGLPSNCIYGILPDDLDRLWVSTNRGLSCFDPKKNSFENYGPNDGCQGFEYNINAFYRASWGEMYFGGVHGFDHFNPDKVMLRHRDFPLYLTDFTVNNKPFPLDTVVGEAFKIKLKHFENNFSISFTALDWQNEGLVTYRYHLAPFHNDWVVVSDGSAVARFVNVPPGDYRFTVEAAGRTGVWSQQNASIRLAIVPAFWQTGWFKALVTLAVAALLYFLFNFFVKTRYRLRLAALEQAQEKERLRTLIAQDIHDEVGSSLTKISLAAQVASRLPNLSEAELKARMEALGADARHAAGHLREIVFAINPDYDNFEEMQAYFREVSREFWADGTVTLHLDFEKSKTNPTVPPDVKRQLLLIFKEAQNNIAKHAKASQTWLTFKLVNEKSYLLQVRDDGTGFDTADGNGFTHGLSGMEKRAESIQAKLSIESSPLNGTTIKLEGYI